MCPLIGRKILSEEFREQVKAVVMDTDTLHLHILLSLHDVNKFRGEALAIVLSKNVPFLIFLTGQCLCYMVLNFTSSQIVPTV